eukprot:jgi/Mesvir1/16245/Mv08496-RA.2
MAQAWHGTAGLRVSTPFPSNPRVSAPQRPCRRRPFHGLKQAIPKASANGGPRLNRSEDADTKATRPLFAPRRDVDEHQLLTRMQKSEDGAVPGTAVQNGLKPAEQQARDGSDGGASQPTATPWRLVQTMSLAFIICNMDKVNMSVAIIPMSHQMGWDQTTAGVVQSSFFWGYALSQVPGGWLAQRLTGLPVLRMGVVAWSLATAAVPLAASNIPLLCIVRVLVGLGEGIAPPAAVDVVAKTVPASERARAVSVVFGGLGVGSVLGLLLAPQLIETLGWESVFFLFGAVGVIWNFGFDAIIGDTLKQAFPSGGQLWQLLQASVRPQPAPAALPDASSAANGSKPAALLNGASKGLNGSSALMVPADASSGVVRHNASSGAGSGAAHGVVHPEESRGVPVPNAPLPWAAIVSTPAVRAMIVTHFCGNWGHYVLMSWLPTYFTQSLEVDLTGAATMTLLSPLLSIFSTGIAGQLADWLLGQGWSATHTRRLCQSIAFLGPSTCMALACWAPALSHGQVVALLTLGSSLSSFALAGLFCTHQDISPKYASVLLGLTNTFGALPGMFGVMLTGYMLEETGSWTVRALASLISLVCAQTVQEVWIVFNRLCPPRLH